MPTRPLVQSYAEDLRRFPDRWQQVGLVALGVLIVAWPFLATARWITVANQGMTAVVGSLALMLLTGFAGQISLGHAAFLAVGAYTVAIGGKHFGLPFWVTLPLAGGVAAAVGLLVGPFALRLRGLYLAIVTIGLLLLVDHTLLSLPAWTGGVSGTAVPIHLGFVAESSGMGSFSGPLVLGPLELAFEQKLYFLYAALAVGSTLLVSNVRRSRTGRAMMAVRDSDLAAEALGVSPARTKVLAFGLSSFLAGVAGGMFAYQQQYITVEPPFDLLMSGQYIAMIVLGGIGTVAGAVMGALAYVVLTPLAEMMGRELPWINNLSSAQQSTLLFSVLVIVVLVFEPLGLYGIWLRIKRYFLAWPFRY
jgi:branched-chain amino acid transport system permease protein